MDERAPARAPEGGRDARIESLTLSALRVVVAIVNYRTAELVIEGLAALAEELVELPQARVVVVDNASGDGSAERLAEAVRERGWDWCKVVASEVNGGFAYGNNLALRGTGPQDYVLLLNPDTRVRPGALRALLDFMEHHPSVGIAGSRLEDEDGTQQHSRYRFPSVTGELEATLRLGLLTKLVPENVVAPPLVDEAHPCDWVAGASLIVRGETLAAVGPMDERYFLYFEEVDFCRRADDAGWRCWYVPASRVVHHVGQSSGVTSRGTLRERRPRYWFESRRRYFVEHHGRFYTALADLAWLGGMLLWRARVALQRKPEIDPPGLVADFVRYTYLSRDGWSRPHGTGEREGAS